MKVPMIKAQDFDPAVHKLAGGLTVKNIEVVGNGDELRFVLADNQKAPNGKEEFIFWAASNIAIHPIGQPVPTDLANIPEKLQSLDWRVMTDDKVWHDGDQALVCAKAGSCEIQVLNFVLYGEDIGEPVLHIETASGDDPGHGPYDIYMYVEL